MHDIILLMVWIKSAMRSPLISSQCSASSVASTLTERRKRAVCKSCAGTSCALAKGWLLWNPCIVIELQTNNVWSVNASLASTNVAWRKLKSENKHKHLEAVFCPPPPNVSGNVMLERSKLWKKYFSSSFVRKKLYYWVLLSCTIEQQGRFSFS